jgi:hypothetical protein
MIQPTDRLLEWAKACATAKAGNLDADSHETPPSPVLVNFSTECADLIMKFDAEMIEAMNSHDRLGLDAMFGRTKEKPMASRRARERGDKHDRWEFQPDWRDDRDSDDDELPERDDDDQPSKNFH